MSDTIRSFAQQVCFGRVSGEGICPVCGLVIDPGEFRDALSRKEYVISGMCQRCQDEVFGDD